MNDPIFSWQGTDNYRSKRIRRSSLLHAKLDAFDQPNIAVAETSEEYIQAFRLVHDAYVESNYLTRGHPGGLYFNVHQLLPQTRIFLFKSLHTVIATMSYIPDTPQFGLPMDALYKAEIDSLRRKGHKIVELGSLATTMRQRGNNINMLLARAAFQFAMATDVDDVCIMTNPKHFKFYNSIFLFEAFGEKRHYGKINAPAVALRVDMRSICRKLRERYDTSTLDGNVCAFLTKSVPPLFPVANPYTMALRQDLSRKRKTCERLLTLMPLVPESLSGEEYAAFCQCYEEDEAKPERPRIILPGGM